MIHGPGRLRKREFHVDAVAIKALRSRIGLSQSKFVAVLHVDVGMLRNGEQGRREPTGPAKALPTAISRMVDQQGSDTRSQGAGCVGSLQRWPDNHGSGGSILHLLAALPRRRSRPHSPQLASGRLGREQRPGLLPGRASHCE